MKTKEQARNAGRIAAEKKYGRVPPYYEERNAARQDITQELTNEWLAGYDEARKPKEKEDGRCQE